MEKVSCIYFTPYIDFSFQRITWRSFWNWWSLHFLVHCPALSESCQRINFPTKKEKAIAISQQKSIFKDIGTFQTLSSGPLLKTLIKLGVWKVARFIFVILKLQLSWLLKKDRCIPQKYALFFCLTFFKSQESCNFKITKLNLATYHTPNLFFNPDPIFGTLYFEPYFFQGRKQTHVFKTRIMHTIAHTHTALFLQICFTGK